MTVRQGEANSHQHKGWEEFTDAAIGALKKKEGIVYLLWGKAAQEKCKSIDRNKNTVIIASHPSPLGGTYKIYERLQLYFESIPTSSSRISKRK